ncbi:hypothetical protein L1987_51149 [Smallanthus sonchifolius]|uniref:Uncharacterized protein n=1 Tax=Smallanthus sonchifolius TaxID=185202 RepID=A0ACB9EPU9_9ASTR|nr:hypothetical protein L1987_51149 [Smallanthus sonchifolius]
MVGIMVAKDWNLQEEIILKWRDKEYSFGVKTKRMTGARVGVSKTKKSESAAPAPSNQTTESAASTSVSPESAALAPAEIPFLQKEVEKSAQRLGESGPEGSHSHGKLELPCTGTNEQPLNASKTKENKRHAFHFASGHSNLSLDQKICSGPSSSSAIIDVRRESDFDEGGNPKSEEETRSVDQEKLNNEIKATIELGQSLGINLRNREDVVRAVVQGEGEKNGLP